MVRRGPLEARVMDALGRQLMQPDRVTAFCQAFIAEWNTAQADASAEATVRQRELQGVQRKIDNLVEAIAEGVRSPDLQRKLDELNQRRQQLTDALEDRPAPAPALHPNLAQVYANRVGVLREAIRGRNDPELLEAARALVDTVVVGPGKGPDDPPEIELVGRLVEMLRAGGAALEPEDAAVSGALDALASGSVKGGSGGSAPPIFAPMGQGRGKATHQRPVGLGERAKPSLVCPSWLDAEYASSRRFEYPAA